MRSTCDWSFESNKEWYSTALIRSTLNGSNKISRDSNVGALPVVHPPEVRDRRARQTDAIVDYNITLLQLILILVCTYHIHGLRSAQPSCWSCSQ